MDAETIDAQSSLTPPDDAAVWQALSAFAAAVRSHYGQRLRGIYLFGSRARGDHRPDSDADVAIVLADDGWSFWTEKVNLVDLAFDPMVDSGLHISPWPFVEPVWLGERQGRYFDVAQRARRDAASIETRP